MKKLVLLVAVLSGMSFVSAKKPAPPIERQIEAFTSLSVSNSIQVIFTEGEPKLQFEADAKVAPMVKIEQYGSNLKIYRDKGWHKSKSGNMANMKNLGIAINELFQNNKIIVYLQTPNINNVQVSGGASFQCSEFTASRLQAKVTGGGKMNIDAALSMEHLRLTVSGGCKITMSVKEIENVTVNQSGGSKIDLQIENQVKRLRVNQSGGSKVNVAATQIHSVDVGSSGGTKVDLQVAQPSDNMSVVATGGSTVTSSEYVSELSTRLSGGSRVKVGKQTYNKRKPAENRQLGQKVNKQ